MSAMHAVKRPPRVLSHHILAILEGICAVTGCYGAMVKQLFQLRDCRRPYGMHVSQQVEVCTYPLVSSDRLPDT
jgi:hypothetical protein